MLINLDDIQVEDFSSKKGAGANTVSFSSLEVGPAKAELENALGQIENGHTYVFATKGAWSAHHLLEYIVRHVGECELILASWAFSENSARTVQSLRKEGLITKLTCFLSEKVKKHYSAAASMLEMSGTCYYLKSHAKAILIENEKFTISIVMTANFSANRRLEIGTLLTDETSYQFFKQQFEQEIKE